MRSIITILCLALACTKPFCQDVPENALDFFLPGFCDQQISVRDFALSPGGDEIYFSVESVKKNISFIVFSKMGKSGWSPAEVVHFSGQYRDIEPSFSPDGNHLYFASNRPLDPATQAPKDYDIWMVHRNNPSEKWSEPENPGQPVNSEQDEYYPSITNSGNLYFTSTLQASKGREDIFVCKFEAGKYLPAESLSTSVNTAAYEFNAWVAPDESLIIFSSYGREDGNGGGDLYYSTRDDYGQWRPSLNFGLPINSSKLDYCPFYDLNTQTLYFTSERTAVKKYYPEKLSFEAFRKEVSQPENGLGRIYRIPFKFED